MDPARSSWGLRIKKEPLRSLKDQQTKARVLSDVLLDLRQTLASTQDAPLHLNLFHIGALLPTPPLPPHPHYPGFLKGIPITGNQI